MILGDVSIGGQVVGKIVEINWGTRPAEDLVVWEYTLDDKRRSASIVKPTYTGFVAMEYTEDEL